MGRTSVNVRRARVADKSAATTVLADAFATDPVMSWLVGPGRDAATCLGHLFGHSLRLELGRDDHLVDVVDSGGAVAVWHEVDEWDTPALDVVKMLPTAIRTFGRHLPRAVRTLSVIQGAHPPEPHRHLEYIGVHSERQGRGLGGALLESMTAECDAMGVAAYLESSNRNNEPLYVRYGFEPGDPLRLPGGGPVVIPMWRPAR